MQQSEFYLTLKRVKLILLWESENSLRLCEWKFCFIVKFYPFWSGLFTLFWEWSLQPLFSKGEYSLAKEWSFHSEKFFETECTPSMREIVIPLHLETLMFISDNIVQVCNQTLPFEVSESDHSPQMKLRKAVYRSLPLVNNIARLWKALLELELLKVLLQISSGKACAMVICTLYCYFQW